MNDTYLKELANVNIQTVPKESLVDIKEVKIEPSLEREERVSSFVRQIKNPYCFLCDGIIVKMNFSETGETLEDKLNRYFLSL